MSTAESRRKAKEEYLKLLQQQKESATAANGAANAILQSEEKVQATDTSANRREQILAEKRKAFFEGKHVDNVKPIIPSTENYIDRRQQIRPPIPESSNSNQARVSDWKKMGFPSEYAYAHHLGLLENGTSKAEISIDRKVSSIDHPHFPPDSSQLEEASRIVIKNGDTSSSGVTGSDGKGEIVDKVSYGGKGNDEKEARRMKQAEYAKLLNEQISHDKQRLLEVNLPVIKENDEAKMDELVGGGGLQIGFQSQLDKDAKRRQQMEYADALQRDQYKRQQHSIGVREEETRADRGRDFGERLDRNGSSQTGWNQGGHRNNGSDQALYRAQEVGEGEGARWERREKREGIGGGGVSGVGMMIGSEVSKEEKRARQAEYARALDNQLISRSPLSPPRLSPRAVKDYISQQPKAVASDYLSGSFYEPSSSSRKSEGNGGFVGVGAVSEKELKRRKQQEYAQALQQQMAVRSQSNLKGRSVADTIDKQRSPRQNRELVLPSSPALSSNELGPGWVMGPLGVPVRKTLEVGNRGVQKAFLEHVHHQSNSPPKPPVSLDDTSFLHPSSSSPPPPIHHPVSPLRANSADLFSRSDLDEKMKKKLLQQMQREALEEQVNTRQKMKDEAKERERKAQEKIERENKELQENFEKEVQAKKAKLRAAEEERLRELMQREERNRPTQQAPPPQPDKISTPDHKRVATNQRGEEPMYTSRRNSPGTDRSRAHKSDLFDSMGPSKGYSVSTEPTPFHKMATRTVYGVENPREYVDEMVQAGGGDLIPSGRTLKTLPHESRFMFPNGELLDLRSDSVQVEKEGMRRLIEEADKNGNSWPKRRPHHLFEANRDEGEMVARSEFVSFPASRQPSQPADTFKRSRPPSSTQNRDSSNPLLVSLPGYSSLLQQVRDVESENLHLETSQTRRGDSSSSLRDILHDKVEESMGSLLNSMEDHTPAVETNLQTNTSRSHSRPTSSRRPSQSSGSSMRQVLDMSSLADSGKRVMNDGRTNSSNPPSSRIGDYPR